MLISREYKKARLIDIDGASQGSIQFPSAFVEGATSASSDDESRAAHPTSTRCCCSYAGSSYSARLRGKSFVSEQVSRVRRACEDQAKTLIRAVLREKCTISTVYFELALRVHNQYFHRTILYFQLLSTVLSRRHLYLTDGLPLDSRRTGD